MCAFQLRELEVFDAQSIARAVTEGARNDLEKLRAVWIWLCHNIGNCTCARIYAHVPLIQNCE